MDDAQLLGIVLGGGVLGALLVIIFIRTHIVLCQPNELVVIAGRQRTRPDGGKMGYRVLRGGRGFKMPLVESVARLPLTALPVQVQLSNAMCDGMIPVSIDGRANVKLAGRPEDGSDAAIERFLGKGPDAVTKTAQQAIEGALRGVVATVTPEEANSRRLELAQAATENARENLRGLGIVLDFFVINDVSDSQGYLEAIGRRRNSEVKRDALIAEAKADADAATVAAEQRRVAREAELAAEHEIITRENSVAVHRADLEATTNQAEQRARVAGDIARTEQEIELESRRVQLSEKHEEAATVIPARAARDARALEAEGYAARIRADGRATAEAVELMRAQWDDGASHELFLIRMLPELLDKVTRVVADNLRVDKLTILDGGDGEGLPNYVRNLANSAVTLMEQVENATGVDLAKVARQGTDGQGSPVPPELD
jgi:flotillin